MPALEAHLTFDKAVRHGETKHSGIDALLNVKPDRASPSHNSQPNTRRSPRPVDGGFSYALKARCSLEHHY